MKYRTRLPAAILLVLAGACGSPEARDATSTDPPAVTTTTPSPSPAITSAADGANLDACADGTCEVRLDAPATIAVDKTFGVDVLRVVSFTQTEVTFDVVDAPGGGFSFGCDHESCAMSVTGASIASPARGTGSASTNARITANRLVVEVVAVSDTYTILRLTPASG
ncbi:hypothetical protein [Allorhizocola rhizosphaerae]|uniref:hypothetical protein n=1 Tax=Allorhizocola rhizosphaerae TaxID=1872709 RepID=UPI0013C2AAB4|nr:hypothetical protein [Allorhizocola rhizosphaerae]